MAPEVKIRATIVGESKGTSSGPRDALGALADAAEQAVRANIVTPDRAVWFKVTDVEVEIANQHVRTCRATLTGGGGGGG